jgi:hypothetical protein
MGAMSLAAKTLVTLLALAWTTTAEAQVGFTFAARLGFAAPSGSALQTPATGSIPLAPGTSIAFPIQLDAGVRIAKRLVVGAYGSYQLSTIRTNGCQAGASCAESGVRAGLEVLYSFETKTMGPWVGIASGWEWSFANGTIPEANGSATLSGWEYAQLQAGYDFWLTGVTRLGFYLSASVGEFSRVDVAEGATLASGSIPGRTLHGWFQMGFKTTFDL